MEPGHTGGKKVTDNRGIVRMTRKTSWSRIADGGKDKHFPATAAILHFMLSQNFFVKKVAIKSNT